MIRKESTMENNLEETGKDNLKQSSAGKSAFSRRTILKALAGIPVIGALGWSTIRNYNYADARRATLISDLGLDNMRVPVVPPRVDGDMLKIGMVGTGSRGMQLFNALGYIRPGDLESRRATGMFDSWLLQEDLNIAVVGVCDPFDLHAQMAIEAAQSEIRIGRNNGSQLPVKRFKRYEEMLEDKSIDAIIIATPDHHHAKYAMMALQAGKHVYCEKCTALKEDELHELFDVVKQSDRVYQIGHQIPQNAIYQQAKEIIERGLLGQITLIQTFTNRNNAFQAWIRHVDSRGNLMPGDEKSIDWVQWLGDAPYVPFDIERFYNWTFWFDYNTGVLGQQFSHEFDAMNYLLDLGIPHTVVTSGGTYYWHDNREMPDVLQTVLEYPERGLSLTYSATLANSHGRERTIMGHDATMQISNALQITADRGSTRYREQLAKGIIDSQTPMITLRPGATEIDAITSASARYYAERGLTTTTIGGRPIDVSHLHLKDWIDCIRNGSTPRGNIEKAYEVGVALLMAHRAYLEKRQVRWDPVQRRIV